MDITLGELIDHVREELLSPHQGSTLDAKYPFLFVEEVELEVNVVISKKANGTGKVNIKVVELGGGIEKTDQRAHRIKIKMIPLLTKEEIREKLKQDKQLWGNIEVITMRATTKEGSMVGEE
jgi:hypothetical protein